MSVIARLDNRNFFNLESNVRSIPPGPAPRYAEASAKSNQTPGGAQNSSPHLDVLAELPRSTDGDGSSLPRAVEADRIAMIEPRVFLRECIRRGMEKKFQHRFDTFSNVEEFERDVNDLIRLVILSCSGTNELESGRGRASIERLIALAPHAPVVVLAARQDPELMRLALATGAKGYILMSMGFDLVVEAVRFVLAGGSYVPVEVLVAADAARAAPVQTYRPVMTTRETLVIRAIKQGKPNKLIAYELNMCESTVKVHVRSIMKKLGAKNRTAVAMRASELLA